MWRDTKLPAKHRVTTTIETQWCLFRNCKALEKKFVSAAWLGGDLRHFLPAITRLNRGEKAHHLREFRKRKMYFPFSEKKHFSVKRNYRNTLLTF